MDSFLVLFRRGCAKVPQKALNIFARKWRFADIFALVCVLGIVYVFNIVLMATKPRALHKNTVVKTARDEKTYYVSGSDFMKLTPEQVRKKYGYRIVHQTWKNSYVEDEQYEAFIAWEKVVDPTTFVHVLWTDDDNEKLMRDYYPQFLTRYSQLVLPVQKTDYIRLLYLHRYAGIYADLDIMPHSDVFNHLEDNYSRKDADGNRKLHDALIVESPILLNEVMQNAFMVASEQKNGFFMGAAEGIHEIITFIHDKRLCKKWNGCQYIYLFHNQFLYRFTNMLMTLYMTGPAVLDKVYTRHILDPNRKETWDVVKLPKEEYYMGTVVSHKQDNTWINASKAVPELINLTFVFVTFVCFLIIYVWHQMRVIRSLKSHMNRPDPLYV